MAILGHCFHGLISICSFLAWTGAFHVALCCLQHGQGLCCLGLFVIWTSLCCSVPFLKPSEWVPFSTRLKSSVNSLLWQISISLNLFPGVDAALKLLSENIQFPSVFFKKYSVYLCVCVQNACFRGTCKFVWADFSTGLSHPEPLYDTRQPAAYLVRVLPPRAVLRCTTAPLAPTGKLWGIPGDSGLTWFRFSSRLDSGGSCERKWVAGGQEARFGQLGFGGLRGMWGVSRVLCSVKGWGGNLCSFLVADFLSKIIT